MLTQGQSFFFSFTTATVLNAGTVVNVVTVAGQDNEGSTTTATDTTTVTVIDVPPTLTVVKSAPATIVEGNVVTYTFTITNTSPAGTDPLTITSVSDDVLGDLTSGSRAAAVAQARTDLVLAPGQSFSFTVTTATPLDAGTVVNTVTVGGHDDENTPASASDSHTLAITNAAPSLAVSKSAVDILEGTSATFTFTITNASAASTDPVTITSVTDNVLGDLTAAANAAWLAQGHTGALVLAQNQAFSFTFTTAALDAGTPTNTVTVLGHDDEGTAASGSDSHTLTVANVPPTIAVDKTTVDIAEGTSATFTFTITNTSATSTDPVTITSVVDNVLGDLTAAANAAWLAQGHTGAIVLAPNQSFSFNFTTAVLNAGTVSNTVTVQGRDNENTTTSAQDSHSLIVGNVAPVIAVAKSGPASIAEGNPVSYTFAIRNASAASTDPLTITSVVDDVLGDLTAAANAAWLAQGHTGAIVLAPNQTFTFGVTTATAVNVGTVVNTVTVAGHDDENSPASAQDSHTLQVTNAAPTITVDKSAPADIAEGNVVTYRFTITNTSPASTDPVTIH